MFDIGWVEILVILVIAVIFIGPEDLPKAMRVVGGYFRQMKFLITKLQVNVDHMLHESEIHEIHKQVEDLKNGYPVDKISLDDDFPSENISKPREVVNAKEK